MMRTSTKVLKSLPHRPMDSKRLTRGQLQEGVGIAAVGSWSLVMLSRTAFSAYFACSVSMYFTRFVTLCCTWASCPWLMVENSGPQTGISWLPWEGSEA